MGAYQYDAWGNLLSQSGEMAGLNPLTYRGYLYDSETKNYYLQSRYYSPEWKRFLNADSIVDNKSLPGANLMAYCLNDPVNRVDPEGQLSFNQYLECVNDVVNGLLAFERIIRNDAKLGWLFDPKNNYDADTAWNPAPNGVVNASITVFIHRNGAEMSAYILSWSIAPAETWYQYYDDKDKFLGIVDDSTAMAISGISSVLSGAGAIATGSIPAIIVSLLSAIVTWGIGVSKNINKNVERALRYKDPHRLVSFVGMVIYINMDKYGKAWYSIVYRGELVQKPKK